ncbi:hypothetical protein ACP275_05G122000 [Erythranthe tilingii]
MCRLKLVTTTEIKPTFEFSGLFRFQFRFSFGFRLFGFGFWFLYKNPPKERSQTHTTTPNSKLVFFPPTPFHMSIIQPFSPSYKILLLEVCMGLKRICSISKISGQESPELKHRFQEKKTRGKYGYYKEIDVPARNIILWRFSDAICYLWRRAKALNGPRPIHYRAPARYRKIEHQMVVVVDPYFSVPVIPV